MVCRIKPSIAAILPTCVICAAGFVLVAAERVFIVTEPQMPQVYRTSFVSDYVCVIPRVSNTGTCDLSRAAYVRFIAINISWNILHVLPGDDGEPALRIHFRTKKQERQRRQRQRGGESREGGKA